MNPGPPDLRTPRLPVYDCFYLADVTRQSALKRQPTPGMKRGRTNRGWLRATYLLSTFASVSRRYWANEAANLGGQGHFFVGAVYWF